METYTFCSRDWNARVYAYKWGSFSSSHISFGILSEMWAEKPNKLPPLIQGKPCVLKSKRGTPHKQDQKRANQTRLDKNSNL